MANFIPFSVFKEALPESIHSLNTDTLKVALTNTAPNPSSDTVFEDIVEITAGNGYVVGGSALQNVTSIQSGEGYRLDASNVLFTASGGSIPAFRYAVLYNSTANSLIGYWDSGSTINLSDGNSSTLIFSGSGVFRIDSTTPIDSYFPEVDWAVNVVETPAELLTIPNDVNNDVATASGIYLNSAGTKLVVCDNHGQSLNVYDAIRVWEVSTPFSLGSVDVASNELTAQSLDIQTETTDPSDVTFNEDGSIMFVTAKNEKKVLVYDLSTPFNPSTGTYNASKTLDTTGVVAVPSHVEFVKKRSEMHVSNLASDRTIHVYELSTVDDPSTGTIIPAKEANFNTWFTGLRSFYYRRGGSVLMVAGFFIGGVGTGGTIAGFDLTEPYNPATAVRNTSYDIVSPANTIGDFIMLEDEKKVISSQLTGGPIFTSEPQPVPRRTTLWVDMNYTANTVTIRELYVKDLVGVERFNSAGLTSVDSDPANTQADVGLDEYTVDSNSGGVNTARTLQDGNLGSGAASQSSSSSLNVFIKWSDDFYFETIEIYLRDPVTFGFPSPIFKDFEGNVLTPVESPADVNDFIDNNGADRLYRWRLS